jgi:hypothetical protein
VRGTYILGFKYPAFTLVRALSSSSPSLFHPSREREGKMASSSSNNSNNHTNANANVNEAITDQERISVLERSMRGLEVRMTDQTVCHLTSSWSYS